MAPPQKISDTVSITSDGRAVVDVRKLLGKKHMQETIQSLRNKTTFVTRRRESAERPVVRVNIDRG